MSSVIGNDGVDILIPDGVNPDNISISDGKEGTSSISIEENIKGIEVTATEPTTEIDGKKVVKSTISVEGKKGTESSVVINTKALNKSTISNDGKGKLDVEINGSTFNKSVIDAGDRKRADNISFKGKANVKNSEIKVGKGNDAIVFGQNVSFKGKTTIDLGQGGQDSIVIAANKVKGGGKLKVTNFTKKDTITVGDETFTYKDIKNGAEIPGIKVELA